MNKTIVSFLLLFILNNFSFAQYTQDDFTLIETTFKREFNKEIIYNYFRSNDSAKINAALLSVSHSEDTTFIDSIIELDFNKYGDFIAFALGQIGTSKKSTNYLLQTLVFYDNPFLAECFEAIGKCGDSLTLHNLFTAIEDSAITSDSFPLAIANFQMRGIQNQKSLQYLTEYLNSNLDEKQLFQTLFALNRLGSDEKIIPILYDILLGDYSEINKLYALYNFRKLKYFPNDVNLLKQLINSDSWRIRTETANSACYFPFKSNDEVELYLSLLKDNNPNVSRSSAISLKNIKFSANREWLKNKIKNLLSDNRLIDNTKGELLISYINLFNLKADSIINDYEDLVKLKFIFRLLAYNTSEWEFNFDFLKDRIEESNEIELLDLLPAYLALQNKYINSDEYAAHLFNVFQTGKPSSVSIIADGLKPTMIHHYRELLQELITEQVFINKNNPQFAEAIVSLANLSYKVDRVFYDSIIDMLATSQLYSVKKFAFEKLGINFLEPKNENLFSQLWNSAFKYKFAEVQTNKGNFKIELLSNFAPMTCSNFISLAEKEFYNGVTFHRVVPDFVIQTGDTTGTGWGGPGYEIVSEFSPLSFDRGAVGIASIGKDTEGSQWFVMHSLFPHLNGRYTNWAKVISGMEIVDIIDEGDKIIKIKLSK